MASKTRLIFEGDNRTRRAFNEINSSMGRLRGSLSGAVAGAKLFTGILAAGFLGRAAKQTLDFADQVQKLNLRLGASTEFLSEMRFVAEQSGVAFDQFALALQRSQRRIGEAAAGTGEAQDALRELGVDAAKLAQLPVDEQFLVLAASLAEVENATERLRLGFKLFDSEGAAVLQIIEGGVENMQQLRDRAREAGVSLSQDAADGAAAANDALNGMVTALRGVVQELVINFGPALEAVGNFLANVIPRALNLAKAAWEGWAGAVASLLSGLLETMANFGDRVAQAMDVFFLPGAGSVQAAADTLRGFSSTLGEFGGAALEGAGENLRLALSFREVGAAAAEAGKPVKDLVDSVRAPDTGVEGVMGNDQLWANLFKTATEEAEPELDRLQERIAGSLARGAQDGADGMLGAFRSVLQELSTELLQSAFLQLLRGGGEGGGLFGFIGNLFGGGGGGKQAGGAFGPGVYRFGETGPETVAIGAAGIAYPFRGGGSGGGVVNYNIDARGADPTAAVRIREALANSQVQTIARMREMERRRR